MSSPSRRRPTVKDVAAQAGVAPMTVSYAFNHPERVAEATRERVLAAASELDYHPDQTARSLRSGRTHQLGVVVGEHLSYMFDDPQATPFLAGIADVCVREGLGMVLIPTTGDRSDVQRVLDSPVDGYVLWTTSHDDPVVAAVASSGRPAAIQGGPPHPALACVGPDDRSAAASVASCVLSTNDNPVVISFPLDRSRKAGILTGAQLPTDLLDPTQVPFPVTAARLAGYRDAVLRAGHDWQTVRIAIVARNERREGKRAMEAMLSDMPDAVTLSALSMSDELALGAGEALAGSDHQATLTGWDASTEALGHGVWSIKAPLREQGKTCAEAVLAGRTGILRAPWQVVEPRR